MDGRAVSLNPKGNCGALLGAVALVWKLTLMPTPTPSWVGGTVKDKEQTALSQYL